MAKSSEGLKAEMRCVTRRFQHYTSTQRANLAASTHRRRSAVGEYEQSAA